MPAEVISILAAAAFAAGLLFAIAFFAFLFARFHFGQKVSATYAVGDVFGFFTALLSPRQSNFTTMAFTVIVYILAVALCHGVMNEKESTWCKGQDDVVLRYNGAPLCVKISDIEAAIEKAKAARTTPKL